MTTPAALQANIAEICKPSASLSTLIEEKIIDLAYLRAEMKKVEESVA